MMASSLAKKMTIDVLLMTIMDVDLRVAMMATMPC
jgi:hypothetical protein